MVEITNDITLGGNRMVLFAGPCAVESYDVCFETATKVKAICIELGIDYVFKASFDKANRTSSYSYRGLGKDAGLEMLSRIKKELNIPIVTDVHEASQCNEVAEIVDVIQIPAFLCRQTDLLKAAAKTGKAIKIKKGQFMPPEYMQHAVLKVKEAGNDNVFITERGTTFGYNDLVVDFRSIPIMREYAPIVFDVTHSGGHRIISPHLAFAAAAVGGVAGFFIETHPDPDKALCDGPSMIPLDELKPIIERIHKIWSV